MGIETEITSDMPKLLREIEDIRAHLRTWQGRALNRAVKLVFRQVRTEHLTGGTTATRLRRREGRLHDSLTMRYFEESGGPVGVIGTNVPYARMHEFGKAHHTARTKKFLTIPLPASLDRGGKTRWTAGELKDDPGRGGFTGTFIAKGVIFGKLGTTSGGRQRTTSKGTLFGAKSDIVPLFVLKRSVKIPKRSFLQASLNEKAREIEHIFAQEHERGLRA